MLGEEEFYWLGLFQLGRVINTQRLLLTTAPSDPTLDTIHAAVAAAGQSVTPFEDADTSLAPGAVSLAATKPALMLLARLVRAQSSKGGNAD